MQPEDLNGVFAIDITEVFEIEIAEVFETVDSSLLLAIGILAGGFLLGLLIDTLLLGRMLAKAKQDEKEGRTSLLKALRGFTTFWFTAAGLYFALLYAPLQQQVSEAASGALQVLVAISITLSLTLFVSNVVTTALSRYTSSVEGVLPSTTLLFNVTRTVIFVIGGLVALNTLGISVVPILTALGVGGLALALALQDTLSNLFAGLQILASRQIRLGDYIQLESGEEGYVADLTWRNTTIRAMANNMLIIPNSKVAANRITNFNLPSKEMSVLVEVGVNYASDLEKVEEVTLDVARQTIQEVEGAQKDFDPLILYRSFGESSINFIVILRANEFVKQFALVHEFVKRLHQRYNQEKINIPFPIRTVYLKQQQDSQITMK
ncbi:mechanosensitive ion channel family protein [Dethiobacter alkaliphilus]|uniref:MscS Mechanosensitive ion channel n=1 Tax=Dethiobacter alkaliphilus AHT 1 TaxID=555088 RepID=C0GK97_DETAL|nr:mechanosensitive ion channel family protein [Dethiobacter alkaliphilus]EEG76212.1 MscS Mechanosensitive ion channel [Dethiobacter alkaliphilus AHT 1]